MNYIYWWSFIIIIKVDQPNECHILFHINLFFVTIASQENLISLSILYQRKTAQCGAIHQCSIIMQARDEDAANIKKPSVCYQFINNTKRTNIIKILHGLAHDQWLTAVRQFAAVLVSATCRFILCLSYSLTFKSFIDICPSATNWY